MFPLHVLRPRWRHRPAVAHLLCRPDTGLAGSADMCGAACISGGASGDLLTKRPCLLCRRMLLQSSPLTVTTNTITDSPSTAAQNIRNAIADGSLQAQLTPLGLSIVPGSLGTSNVSVHDPGTLNPKPGCAGKPVHLEYACVNARAILLLTRLGAVVWGVHICTHVRLLLHLLHISAHLHVCVSVMRGPALLTVRVPCNRSKCRGPPTAAAAGRTVPASPRSSCRRSSAASSSLLPCWPASWCVCIRQNIAQCRQNR